MLERNRREVGGNGTRRVIGGVGSVLLVGGVNGQIRVLDRFAISTEVDP